MVWTALAAAAGGALIDNYFAKERQEDAQSFNAQQFATRYQTQVKDLAAAGLNPMLAYTQGPGAGASSGISSPGSQFSSAGMTAAQIENIKADTENKITSSENIKADTKLKLSSALTQEAQTLFLGASADQARASINQLEFSAKKIAEEIKNIPKEGQRLDALVKNLTEEYNILREKGLTQVQVTNQIKWLARKAMLDGDLVSLDVDAAKSLDNIGREGAQFKPVIDVLRLLMRR